MWSGVCSHGMSTRFATPAVFIFDVQTKTFTMIIDMDVVIRIVYRKTWNFNFRKIYRL